MRQSKLKMLSKLKGIGPPELLEELQPFATESFPDSIPDKHMKQVLKGTGWTRDELMQWCEDNECDWPEDIALIEYEINRR